MQTVSRRTGGIWHPFLPVALSRVREKYSNGYNGVICKILVCDLFDSQGILYNYSPEERLKYTMKSLIKSLNEE